MKKILTIIGCAFAAAATISTCNKDANHRQAITEMINKLPPLTSQESRDLQELNAIMQRLDDHEDARLYRAEHGY